MRLPHGGTAGGQEPLTQRPRYAVAFDQHRSGPGLIPACAVSCLTSVRALLADACPSTPPLLCWFWPLSTPERSMLVAGGDPGLLSCSATSCASESCAKSDSFPGNLRAPRRASPLRNTPTRLATGRHSICAIQTGAIRQQTIAMRVGAGPIRGRVRLAIATREAAGCPDKQRLNPGWGRLSHPPLVLRLSFQAVSARQISLRLGWTPGRSQAGVTYAGRTRAASARRNEATSLSRSQSFHACIESHRHRRAPARELL